MLLSFIGLLVSWYLYYSKTHDKRIYCLMGHDCEEVVRSKYGKTFGIENTLIGMLYYLLIFVYGILLIGIEQPVLAFLNRNIFIGKLVYYLIVGAGIGSVGFSVYLTAVQAFVLKKWCDYCIISSIVSVLILVVLVI